MNTPETHNDETAEMLRRAMAAEAAEVETDATALQRIRRRTSSAPSPLRERWVFGALGAAAATAAVITAVVVIGDNSGNGSNGTPPASQPPTSEVPVFYVGPQPSNADLAPRLYSEPHTVPVADSTPAEAAVHEFLTSQPIDPDYESGWPEGVDVTGITADGGVTTIALAGDADLGARGELEGSCIAQPQYVQTLLRTAGVEEAARFTYNGDPVDSLFYCVDVSPSVAVQSDDDVRAFITIDNIVEGQTMANPVTVEVSGNVFEGTVNWQLFDGTDAKVDEGFVTTAFMEWRQVEIPLGDLEPGTYTLRALEYSMEDGSPRNIDDKTFIVE